MARTQKKETPCDPTDIGPVEKAPGKKLHTIRKGCSWFGIILALFFLFRASEYLVQEKVWSVEWVLHGDDFFMRDRDLECRTHKL